ncbi:MAG: hypothetical protein ACPGIA_10010 [Luteolibacter sp.]
MKTRLTIVFFALFCAILSTVTARDLDVTAADVKKQEIRHGQIGPRDTLIFYTFGDQDTVLQLNIKHAEGKFTLSGKMQLFKEGTGAEGMRKWVNNQHSCGLFPDVPKPTAVELPAMACTVLESKLLGIKPGLGGRIQLDPAQAPKFEDHSLKIQVSELKMDGFRLKSFTLDTGAFVRVVPAE